jgi:hypothetical protein
VAWYASAAGVLNGMAGRPLLPVGRPFWRERPPTPTTLGPEFKVEHPAARERVW